MKVEKLKLINFRNIIETTFQPDPSVNFLVGQNGQGKTSILEALSFLSTLRSFRDSKVSHVIRKSALISEVSCTLSDDEMQTDPWKTDLSIVFQAHPSNADRCTKTALINGKAFRSSTQYLSQRFGEFELGFHSIIFNPSDHDLVRGEPAKRRSYLNQVLAAEDPEYLKLAQKYQRVLEQRNALLKSDGEGSEGLLIEFTDQLCRYGALIALERLRYLNRLTPLLQPILERIAPHQPALRLMLLSNWVPPTAGLSCEKDRLNPVHFTGQPQLPSLELLEQSFRARVTLLRASERRMGSSLVGPHRDDWTFLLGDEVLKGHGSQGEVRSALLALKLCEIELFQARTGHRPLFLLDDFSSELDRERRSFLLKFLMETDLQTFVTTTEGSSYVGKRYWVQSGTVSEDREV